MLLKKKNTIIVYVNFYLNCCYLQEFIPQLIWDISYCLCYINSTINPFCYALCNATFRKTYVRILSCKWGDSKKQPVNKYYYG